MTCQNKALKLAPLPEQPDDWPFLREWNQPLHKTRREWRHRRARSGEAELAKGISLDITFPDPENVLETAFDDFKAFLVSCRIPESLAFALRIVRDSSLKPNACRLRVEQSMAELAADDQAGIRSGLIWIEDEMCRREGPFLPIGERVRERIIHAHIQPEIDLFSRLDGEGYPDEFLNRLAHQNVNGLMLPLERLSPARMTPEFDHSTEHLFSALRDRVRRYARYGIKLYLYCNEPRAFPLGSRLPEQYPELAGHVAFNCTYYCVSSQAGQNYLAQAMEKIFSSVPELGGVIVICVGERSTHCYSTSASSNNCPRCSKRTPVKVLRDTLAAMEKGIHRGSKKAEVIAWPYSSYICWGEKQTREAASHGFPPRVVMMHNFESAGTRRQLNRWQRADDYWLTYPGPSALFRECAVRAKKQGTEVYAKLMTGCSHEMASVPYLPAPGLVFTKMREARSLGVTGMLANWMSGNDYSLMNKAAGEMCFSPAPEKEADFLARLAAVYWGRNAKKAARAWYWFGRALHNMPLNIGFSYYGPLHNGPVWPLFVEPRNIPLSGNWRNEPSVGDRIGDCTGFQPLADIIVLCRRLLSGWRKGLQIMEKLSPVAKSTEQMEQIAVARALDCQFESGLNILVFYQLREQLLSCPDVTAGIDDLNKMRAILRSELEVSRRLLLLTRDFPRLGFCPEARAYKYHPALIQWRINQLNHELRVAFPAVEQCLRMGNELSRNVSARAAESYACRCLSRRPGGQDVPLSGIWEELADAPHLYSSTPSKRFTVWKAGHHKNALYFAFVCHEPDMKHVSAQADDRGDLGCDDQINIIVQTSQFEPFHRFFVNPSGARDYSYRRGLNVIPYSEGREWKNAMRSDRYYRWTARSFTDKFAWSLVVRIPFKSINYDPDGRSPIWVNIVRQSGPFREREIAYIKKPKTDPWIERHPANFMQLDF